MSYQKERIEFVARFVKDAAQVAPDMPLHLAVEAATLLLRHATTHGNLAVAECNGCPEQHSSYLDAATINKAQAKHEAWLEKRQAQVEARIVAILKPFPGIVADFGGDPRGYTVKLQLPSGAYNTWGGQESGYGIPQRS